MASSGWAVDLNADLGEEVTDDAGLLAVVTSANVACGFHAGTAATIREVCLAAAARGVRVGAQVSYLDREGFGRRLLEVGADVLRDHVAEQVATLSDIAEECGTSVSYVKPHGALYNRAAEDEVHAGAVLAGSGHLPVLGLPGGVLLRLAEAEERTTFTEGFPDRAYVDVPPGHPPRLVARTQPGAVLTDPEEIAARAVDLAREVHSVCVHGDGETAVAAARAVRAALEAAGCQVRPFL